MGMYRDGPQDRQALSGDLHAVLTEKLFGV